MITNCGNAVLTPCDKGQAQNKQQSQTSSNHSAPRAFDGHVDLARLLAWDGETCLLVYGGYRYAAAAFKSRRDFFGCLHSFDTIHRKIIDLHSNFEYLDSPEK